MLGFTPFKKHANKFNYIPRYYDPEKEAREQRRAELHGEREGQTEYRPGQYIRTQRDARAARRAYRDDQGRTRILKIAAAAVLVLLFVYLLYPRLAVVFMPSAETSVQQQTPAVEEFDPTAPITIVPNDYQE